MDRDKTVIYCKYRVNVNIPSVKGAYTVLPDEDPKSSCS
jgi:hypothetical protein